MDAPEPLFSVPVGGDRKIEFFEIAELEAWITRELAAWKWMQSVGSAQPVHSVMPDAQRLCSNLINASSHISPLKNASAENDRRNRLNSIEAELRAHFQRGGIESTSTDGYFVQDVKQRYGDRIAAVAAAWLANIPPHFQGLTREDAGPLFQGLVLAAAFRSGLTAQDQSQLQSADARLREIEGIADRSKAAHAEQLLKLNESKQKSAEFLEASSATVSSTIGDNLQAMTTAIADARTEVDELRRFYAREVSLRGPVSYWESKKWWHRGFFVGWALLFGGVLVAGFWKLEDLWTHLLSQPAATIQLSQVAMVVLSATVYFVLLRAIGRLAMSSTHLANAAHERAVMAKTFLALMEEKHVEADQLKLVLEALFRPSSTGLIKEELVPTSVLEAALRQRG